MNKKINTTVLIIGSGPAGYSAAFRAADLGLDVVIVEKELNLGGVCLNVGCIPSKSLLHLASIIKESKIFCSYGIKFSNPQIDLDKIQSWKNRIILKLNNSLKLMIKQKKIKHITGLATLKNVNQAVVVNSLNEEYDIFFKNLIIATGSKPIKIQQNNNFDTQFCWDSTNALKMSQIPQRLLIVGSGAIGLEMATLYSSFGSNIDIIDNKSNLFPDLDENFFDIFKQQTKNDFNILLDTQLEKIKKTDNKFTVYTKHKDNLISSNIYDQVIISIGRKPNISQLNLEKLGINLNEKKFINVDSQLKTNVSHIYAIGDVVGHPMLAHKGIYEGKIAAEVISGLKRYFNPTVIPNVIYSIPEIAWVGKNINMVTDKEELNNVRILKYNWSYLGKSLASGCESGLTQLIFNKLTGRLIGGSIIGLNAGELINEITLAIEMGCTAEDLSLTIHAHPTLSESVGLAADMF
ncbi:Dihydrolipoyl dehydrogenase [Buchnera aphidicola (Thelaxes suberi)]|uniref:dihydrolipoyl dehydrogenase n=1 Tax=Buchnera aphidicola TaxID=9 RepID=UPI0034649708